MDNGIFRTNFFELVTGESIYSAGSLPSICSLKVNVDNFEVLRGYFSGFERMYSKSKYYSRMISSLGRAFESGDGDRVEKGLKELLTLVLFNG